MFGDPHLNNRLDSYQKIIDIDPSWEMVEIGKIAEVTSSKRIYKSDYVKDGIPFYRTKEIIELEKNHNITLELFISKKKYNKIKTKFPVPLKNEILISAVGTIGVSYVIDNNNPFYFKDGNLLWIRKINKDFNPYFIKFCFDEIFSKNKSKFIAGSSYRALTIINLKKFKIPNISEKEQKKIIDVVTKAVKLIKKQKETRKKLDQLFNSLSYKYFN